MRNKIVITLAVMAFLLTGIVSFGATSTEHRISRLGNPHTAFYAPPLKTTADLQKMVQVSQAGIQDVLQQRNWHGKMEDLIAAVNGGNITETTIAPGASLPFMASRRNKQPAVIDDVVWSGKKGFEAFVVEFDSNGYTTRFFVPKPCGNFWFEETVIPAKPVEPPKVEAPPPPPPPPVAAEPAPPPPPPTPVEGVKHNPFFVAGFVGKERMVREEFLGGRCAPLIGIKAGILPRIGDDAEVELSIGGKINTRDTGNSSLFADVAINGLVGRSFIGGGVSFWDLTISDTRTVAALIQFGTNLDYDGHFQLAVEGRVPFDQFDDISNNYQFWAGIRFRPGR